MASIILPGGQVHHVPSVDEVPEEPVTLSAPELEAVAFLRKYAKVGNLSLRGNGVVNFVVQNPGGEDFNSALRLLMNFVHHTHQTMHMIYAPEFFDATKQLESQHPDPIRDQLREIFIEKGMTCGLVEKKQSLAPVSNGGEEEQPAKKRAKKKTKE